MTNFAFPERMRIKLAADFERVYAIGRAAQDATARVVLAPNALDYPRLGLSVGRRFGNSPRRSRFKRLAREAFRLRRADLPRGFDIIVIPRPGPRVKGAAPKGPMPTLEEMKIALVKLTNQAAANFTRRE